MVGRARVGKDTVANRLVGRFGYQRLAFADEVRELALKANPYVGRYFRLADLVEECGWDEAKVLFPDVRRTLQELGETMRRLDPDHWIRAVDRQISRTNSPIVVTDCRYPNEAAFLRDRHGFTLVKVTRPGVEKLEHPSEQGPDRIVTTLTIANSGTLADLIAQADTLPF